MPSSRRKQPAKSRTRQVPNPVRKPSPRAQSVINYGIHPKAHTAVVGLVNPFSPEAVGAKVPDDDSTPAFTAQIRAFRTIQSDANGNIAASAAPQPMRYNGRSLEVDPSGVVTAVTDYQNPDQGAYLAQTDTYRIVSWGVRVYSILPGLTAQGSVRLITLDTQLLVGLDTRSNLFPEIHPEPVSGLDAYWTSRPTGVDWKAYSQNVGFASWTYLLVQGAGLPASSDCLVMEYVYNVEIIPKFGSVGSTLATPAAPSNPAQLQAASHVHSRKKGAHTSRPSLFRQIADFARDALVDVAASYVPIIGTAAKRAIMPRKRYPMVMDVD